MAEFEEKLDALKKDIIYSNMTDKNATTGTNANVTMLTGIGDVSQLDQTTRYTENGGYQLVSELEDKIFPSL